MDERYLYKVSLVGPSGVGKTTIQKRVVTNKFIQAIESTVGVTFESKKYKVANRVVELQIWDFGGQTRFKDISNLLIRGSDAVLLVYDVSRPVTLDELKNVWIPLTLKNVSSDTILVLDGNKIDLGKRVTGSEIKGVLKKGRIPYYFETSAKTGYGINEVFIELVKKLATRKGRKVLKYKM